MFLQQCSIFVAKGIEEKEKGKRSLKTAPEILYRCLKPWCSSFHKLDFIYSSSSGVKCRYASLSLMIFYASLLFSLKIQRVFSGQEENHDEKVQFRQKRCIWM